MKSVFLIFWLTSFVLLVPPGLAPSRAGLHPSPTPNSLPSIPNPEILRLLPDLRTLPPHDLVWKTNSSGEKILRFGNSVGNFGNGPLEMHGVASTESPIEMIEVTQTIQAESGIPLNLPVGAFEYHPIHGHWHWQGFSRYEVWSVDTLGSLDALVGVSSKVGFCLRDIDAIAPGDPNKPSTWSDRRRYGSCDWKEQGLSPGWIDRYDNHLDGQSIDLSHVQDGIYALVSTVNPDHLIQESSYQNNTAVMYFKIQGKELEVLGEKSPVLVPHLTPPQTIE